MILKDKTALVTGAARGIGKAIALTLVREGADVAVTDINQAGIREVAQEAAKMGRKSAHVVLDVSDVDSVRNGFAEAKKRLGPIDILVNNAGITTNVATVVRMTEDNWNRELAINLSGVFFCTKQVLPDMVARKWGRIINISSGAGTMGGFGQCSYSASKAGMLGFTKVVALEHAKDNITSNVLVLGLVRTDAYTAIREDMRECWYGTVHLLGFQQDRYSWRIPDFGRRSFLSHADFKQGHRALWKTQIVTLAAMAFKQKRYHGTGMDDIAEKLKINSWEIRIA